MAQTKHGSPAGAASGEAASVPELLGVLSHDPFDHDTLALAEQSAGVGVWSIDLTSGMVRATAQFFHIMGIEPTRELVPIGVIRALRHPEDRERVVNGFQRALEDGSDAYEIEYRIIRPDGGVRWIFGRGRVVRDAEGKPARYSGIDLDITDRKVAEAALAAATAELANLNRTLEQRVRERTSELAAEAHRRAEAEARLHQAQKMEAIGQLTSGIAHDFSNILQVISGNLELARLIMQREAIHASSEAGVQRLQGAIDMAHNASRNAAQFVQRLLAFSRQQSLEPTELDINALVVDMAEMIKRLLGSNVHVRTDLAPGLRNVYADRNQLESALLNLIVNARDAMPEGGSLTIETSHLDFDGSYPDDLEPGRYVVIGVSDTGFGIPKELLGKVFEPFFSTKEAGKGTGLGLAMVYSFVKQSQGHVRVHSEVGSGTTVRIYLPQLDHAADGASAAAGGTRPHAPVDPARD